MTKMFRILGKRGRITIPYDIRQHVGFCQNDVLSFTESPDGSAVIVRREKYATTVRLKGNIKSMWILALRGSLIS